MGSTLCAPGGIDLDCWCSLAKPEKMNIEVNELGMHTPILNRVVLFLKHAQRGSRSKPALATVTDSRRDANIMIGIRTEIC